MGSVGSSNNYIRFGKIPTSEQSINYMSLSYDAMDSLRDDEELTPELAKWLKENDRDWRKVNLDNLFEKGVSVFKADSKGMPIIDNMKQLISLSERVDKDIYSVKGKEVGTGRDDEPLLKNVKSQQVKLTQQQLENHIINTLKKNFKTVEGKLDRTASKSIHPYWSNEDNAFQFSYKGLTFKHPKNKAFSNY